MNKQELIKEFREVGIYSLNIFGTEIKAIPTEIAITSIEQLDEPQPVKVPQFVTDWYEKNKEDFETSLFQCIYELFKKRNDSELNEFENWVIDENTKPFQTLVNMHQFGYDVEEEKKFFVKIKCLSEEYKYLNYFKSCREWLFSEKEETKEYRTAHTRKELEEAGFSEVFNSPLFETVEVE